MMTVPEVSIRRVVAQKASGLLAERLRSMILSGEFVPGGLLPPERDLVAESGLSRGSVREALKILETEGLVEIRSGRSGGARVTVPKRTSLARSTELFVRANGVPLDSLLDCRIAVEPTLARLAARNRSSEELENLQTLHREFEASVGDVKEYRRINVNWHLAIASASRNEPLVALMEAISTPLLEATGYEAVTTPDTRRQAVKAHAAVTDAIARQDEDGASRAMEKHLSSYISILRANLAYGQKP